MTRLTHQPDPRLDLVLERIVDAPPELVWKAWTSPEHLKPWFTPAPWRTVDCEIDLRPGGMFRTVMRSPEGQEFPNIGCYLEIVTNEKLVWTNALLPGYRPAPQPADNVAACDTFFFRAILFLERHQKGTKYTALVIHKDEAGRKQHEEVGFQPTGRNYDGLSRRYGHRKGVPGYVAAGDPMAHRWGAPRILQRKRQSARPLRGAGATVRRMPYSLPFQPA